MPQDVNDADLIVVSDTGNFYLVKMKKVGNENRPSEVTPLDDSLTQTPIVLRDAGATLAIMPSDLQQAGCSCTLLNLLSIQGALKPKASSQLKSLLETKPLRVLKTKTKTKKKKG